MKTEEKRIKIAEACGITRCWHGASGRIRGHNAADEWVLVPNYFADLNAMHEAEKTLGYMSCGLFADRLLEIVRRDGTALSGRGCFVHVHATASQRAEAFGRTLNLWTE